MTALQIKNMIRIAIGYGMSKEHAFQMAIQLVDAAHDEKRTAIERFRYEINAEEQRGE